MCPLYPLHLIVLYCCLMLPLLLAVVQASENLAGWKLNFSTPRIGTKEDYFRELTDRTFQVHCLDCPQLEGEKYVLELRNEDPRIAKISHPETGAMQDETGYLQLDIDGYPEDFDITFNVSATFLGFSKIAAKVVATAPNNHVKETGADKDLQLTVTRSLAKKTASKIFGYSVAVLISLAYINMGCALDLEVVKKVLRRPVGPAIGLLAQFVFMPLVSFCLSFIFPSTMPEMRLGLFVTGCSPGGGASNIWTVMFDGNIDLSVTMTAVSTVSVFAMMPLWMFSLGEVIIGDTDIVIPYKKFLYYGVLLFVPICIGISITKCLPKVSKLMVKLIKPLALFLIIFILVCGIWSQFFMVKLISWRIAFVGFALPWLGFAFGCLFSKFCRRERKDIIAIAIETGVQNTGIAIFMLWFTLDHPVGDLAAVVPVAVATFTPFPLLFALIYYRLRARCNETIVDEAKENSESLIESVDASPNKKVTEDSNQNLKMAGVENANSVVV